MITVKSSHELEIMRRAGRAAATALAVAGKAVRPGVTTAELDRIVRQVLKDYGAIPSFLGYGGFPAAACISLNEEVIHGIPTDRRIIKEGDIVKIDCGAIVDGYHGDCADTFFAGEVSDEAKRLYSATRQGFYEGIGNALKGKRIGDISRAIQSFVEQNGFSVVRSFVGHGIGKKLHEDPEVPNYGRAGHGYRLEEGYTLAIEPMINAGAYGVRVLDDGWTVVTNDGRLSCHYENTIAVTAGEPEILTLPEE